VTMFTPVARSLADLSTLVRRNMLRYVRRPDVFAILVIHPLIILLLLRYVLGGEVFIPDYIQYFMPGLFALAVVTGSATIGIELAEDVSSGVVDGLRVLPITRSAFLAARAITDVAKNVLIIPLVGALGVAVGFHLVGSPSRIILAALLLLALGWMFAWISMAIALWTRSVDATQGLALMLAVVFSFASSGFAEPYTMPSWLQHFVKINPVTHVDNAVRGLITTAHGPVAHNVVSSLISIAVVLVIMIPLAVTRYASDLR
jgi:oleandomycin transport system permease protein